MEVAIVGLAMRLTFDPAGVVTEARIAVASVGPRPLRSTGAEAALVGGPRAGPVRAAAKPCCATSPRSTTCAGLPPTGAG